MGDAGLRDRGFLGEPQASAAVDAMYAVDREMNGYVMNLRQVWAHVPEAHEAWLALTASGAEAAGLTTRLKSVAISALAGELGDAYCSYAWGNRLAKTSDPGTAAAVLQGVEAGPEGEALDDRERAVAAWARRLVRDASGAGPADIAALRRAGFDDRAIAGLTAFIAGRIAFSIFNGALGAAPDAELHASAPDAVREAITWGRAPAG
jgi:alkylhydroperoxidase family enzyme